MYKFARVFNVNETYGRFNPFPHTTNLQPTNLERMSSIATYTCKWKKKAMHVYFLGGPFSHSAQDDLNTKKEKETVFKMKSIIIE